MEDGAVSCPAPVGGRLALFYEEWEKITQDVFILSVLAHGFRIIVSEDFPGVLRENTAAPKNLKAHVSFTKEIEILILKNAIVKVDDFPTLCLSPISDPQEIRGSSYDFES